MRSTSPASDASRATTNQVRVVWLRGSSARAARVSRPSVAGLHTYSRSRLPWRTATQSMTAAGTATASSRNAEAVTGPAPPRPRGASGGGGRRLGPRGAPLAQPPVGHERGGPVHRQHAGDAVAPPVQRHEPPLLRRAVDHDHLVRRRRPPGELDLAVVLIGPEPRHR